MVWASKQVGKNFNPEAADFNLEAVFSLGLHNLAEFIGELSTNANKELGIEQASGWIPIVRSAQNPVKIIERCTARPC